MRPADSPGDVSDASSGRGAVRRPSEGSPVLGRSHTVTSPGSPSQTLPPPQLKGRLTRDPKTGQFVAAGDSAMQQTSSLNRAQLDEVMPQRMTRNGSADGIRANGDASSFMSGKSSLIDQRRPSAPFASRSMTTRDSPSQSQVSSGATSFEDMLRDLDVARIALPSSPRDPSVTSTASLGGGSVRDTRRPSQPGILLGAAAVGGSVRERSREGIRAAATIDALLKDLDSSLMNGIGADTAPSSARSSGGPPNLLSLPPGNVGSLRKTSDASSTLSSVAAAAAAAVSPMLGGRSSTAASNLSPRPSSLSSQAPEPLSIGQQIVRKEQERREAERAAREKAEIERLEKEKAERERADAEERERLAAEEAKEKERRDRERRMNERIAIEREDAYRRAAEIDRDGFNDASTPADIKVIVPEYVHGLMRTLKADDTLSPTPDDFITPESYYNWNNASGGRLQDVMCDLLKARFLDPQPQANPANGATATVDLFFKVIEARDLQAKEGKTRDAYCKIEIGDIPLVSDIYGAHGSGSSGTARVQDRSGANTEVFMTEAIKGSLSPLWNQHLDVQGRPITDRIVISVWDVRKEYFLGQVRLTLAEIVKQCRAEGYVSQWYKLEPRSSSRSRDKYVGGEVLLELNIQSEAVQTAASRTPVGQILSELLSLKLNFKSLYTTLLRSCLLLDMLAVENPSDKTSELLSIESTTCLSVWSRMWHIGDAFKVISYLELLFHKYKSYQVPVPALLSAYEAVYANMRANPEWLTPYDKPALLDLLEEMQAYYRTQVTKYKEFYAKNKPDDALESTILMLRMIHKNPFYREMHPNLPESFRAEIKTIMVEACTSRYQKLQQLAAPLDESDVEAVIRGLNNLVEYLTDDVQADNKYFKHPFSVELDIVRLSSECYLKHLNRTFDAHMDVIVGEEAVASASKELFELIRRCRALDDKIVKCCPTIKKTPYYNKFTYERWFGPFISKWLDLLATQTVGWVTNAVKADRFEAINTEADIGASHSSSVTDLFNIIYKEMEVISGLGWANQVQSAAFYQKFAKTVNSAIEQYCDAIGTGEKTETVATPGTAWASLLQTTRAAATVNGPKDITSESCVKLCNLEFSLKKLDEMCDLINVASLTRTVQDYRATLAPSRRPSARSPTTSSPTDDGTDTIKGAFKIQLGYAENLKPATKAGLANAYLVVRVPEGTTVPVNESNDLSLSRPDSAAPLTASSGSSVPSPTFANGASRILPIPSVSSSVPLVLNGSLCELARTRAIYDTLNPTWDETFTTLLPPVPRLEIAVFSRNLITSDELCGRGTVDFDPQVSRLKRRLADHQTHDLFVDLEPQGRVLLRFTMEGEEEDVDFWFRRSRERLIRTRDDISRSLCVKISPYIKEVLVKCLKEHEAVPVPSRNFFTPLLSVASGVQYSTVTATGISIDFDLTSPEVDQHLAPLSDYLNKNFDTLDTALSSKMAQEVIKKIWEDTVAIIESALVPALFGQLERDRRVLNRRQVSFIGWALPILRQFFHCDGAGIPIKILENRKYVEVMGLVSVYFADLARLRREYELSLLQSRERELVIRLVRLRVERHDEISAMDKEEGRKWIERQLVERKDKKGL